MRYQQRIKSLLTTREKRVFDACHSPQRIQDYLDSLSINFELDGDTYMSPRRVLSIRSAHCFEGAVFAAAALAYHGARPLLMDFQTLPMDTDHVIALFHEDGYWGAISKTNHAILRWRDPVYRTPRELAMSYYHEYLLWSGRKSLVAYSKPFDLFAYPPEEWITSANDLDQIAEDLDGSAHVEITTRSKRRKLRRGSPIELRAMRLVEWKEPPGYDGGG